MVSGSDDRSVRRVLGAMTGTSIDGVDLALVEIESSGLGMRVRFVRGRSASLGELAPRLRAVAEQTPLTARAFAELALEFGGLHAREMAALAAGERIDLAVVHGQTIAHAPPASWQLVNPFPIAASLRCAVLADLRQADLVAGGQGAPITPLADWVLFRAAAPRVVLNLGGFANATALPAERATGTRKPSPGALDAIRGADLCACNHLLDRAARRALGQPFDGDGAAAARGRTDESRAERLAGALDRQRAARRSLGTGDECGDRVDEVAAALRPDDALATVVAAVAASIVRGVLELHAEPGDLLVAGGGARNAALMRELERRLPCPVLPTDRAGIPVEFREAAEMAVLGALVVDGVPISLPQVTGRGASVAADGQLLRPAASPGDCTDGNGI